MLRPVADPGGDTSFDALQARLTRAGDVERAAEALRLMAVVTRPEPTIEDIRAQLQSASAAELRTMLRDAIVDAMVATQ
jgi:hypothetical protein